MEAILKLGAEISTPLALIGFAFAAVFLLLQQLVKRNKLPQLASIRSVKLIDRILVFAFAVMLLGVLSSVLTRPRTLEYRGVVQDAVTKDVIEGASVLVLGHNEFFPGTTDIHGSFALKASSYKSAIDATAHVSHPSYNTWEESRRITEDTQVDKVLLRKVTPTGLTIPTSSASTASSAAATPVFEVRWERTDSSGQPFAETFPPITTQNRHGRSDIVASGTINIQTPEARIYSVEYACVGYPCGWSYNPNGGYGVSVQISGDGRSFTWFRKWDGDPAVETYKALLEKSRRVCVRNCT
jgi:hypothetical protein